ncbi:hypothetical protein BDB00DRAFT_838810 [Zychaea mexicana]|uniref:uncharacterized protein n=1 Tax=Zychaea mexicana TaxID=64656 RepID=UPI0022FE60F9|nr:uncharacterized protein BDB00DRAFT_838810 [Zychaea mexicana]KAI9490220.1 hypothetical protein BDB00DRAFT_838810 [Zychaea mexicana]
MQQIMIIHLICLVLYRTMCIKHICYLFQIQVHALTSLSSCKNYQMRIPVLDFANRSATHSRTCSLTLLFCVTTT